MTIKEAIDKVQNVCFSRVSELEIEADRIDDKFTKKSLKEEAKQLSKAARAFRESCIAQGEGQIDFK